MVNNNTASYMDTQEDHVQWPRLDETHLGSVRSFPGRLRARSVFQRKSELNCTLLYEHAGRLTALLKRWFPARAVDGGRFFLRASASTFGRRLTPHAHCDDCDPWPVILAEG